MGKKSRKKKALRRVQRVQPVISKKADDQSAKGSQDLVSKGIRQVIGEFIFSFLLATVVILLAGLGLLSAVMLTRSLFLPTFPIHLLPDQVTYWLTILLYLTPVLAVVISLWRAYQIFRRLPEQSTNRILRQ